MRPIDELCSIRRQQPARSLVRLQRIVPDGTAAGSVERPVDQSLHRFGTEPSVPVGYRDSVADLDLALVVWGALEANGTDDDVHIAEQEKSAGEPGMILFLRSGHLRELDPKGSRGGTWKGAGSHGHPEIPLEDCRIPAEERELLLREREELQPRRFQHGLEVRACHDGHPAGAL